MTIDDVISDLEDEISVLQRAISLADRSDPRLAEDLRRALWRRRRSLEFVRQRRPARRRRRAAALWSDDPGLAWGRA